MARSCRPSPVAEAAPDIGLLVRKPSTLRDEAAADELRRSSPDVIVVAAYGLILPPAVLDVPAFGCLNVHASLLPRWRGAAPIHRAILAGDAETGVSIMRMEEGLDTGPYCVVERVEIGEKSVTELTHELAVLGARALVRALGDLDSGECEWVDQDDSQATYANKVEKSEVALSPHLGVTDALRRIRASSPQAAARAVVAGKDIAALVGHPSRPRTRCRCSGLGRRGGRPRILGRSGRPYPGQAEREDGHERGRLGPRPSSVPRRYLDGPSVSATHARTLALEVVSRVRARDAYAHETLDAVLRKSHAVHRDAAFATRLAYGTIACRGTLDEAVSRFVSKAASLEPTVARRAARCQPTSCSSRARRPTSR